MRFGLGLLLRILLTVHYKDSLLNVNAKDNSGQTPLLKLLDISIKPSSSYCLRLVKSRST
jgi:hypothetical protein